jgi:hypothetical protein
VRAPHLDDVPRIREEDARADHVLGPGAELGERRLHDPQAAACLAVGVRRRVRVVRHDRRRSRNGDVLADAHRAGVADGGGERGLGGDDLALQGG